MMASVPLRILESVSVEEFTHLERVEVMRRGRRPSGALVRRRPTQQQGRALELLGHAIEYLVDSDLNCGTAGNAVPNEAAQILMRLNREVFADCAEVVPFWSGLRGRAVGFLHRGSHAATATPAVSPRT